MAGGCLHGGATATRNANCGAFTGAGIVIGSLCGRRRDQLGDRSAGQLCTTLFRRVATRFEETYGSVLCKDVRARAAEKCDEVVGRAGRRRSSSSSSAASAPEGPGFVPGSKIPRRNPGSRSHTDAVDSSGRLHLPGPLAFLTAAMHGRSGSGFRGGRAAIGTSVTGGAGARACNRDPATPFFSSPADVCGGATESTRGRRCAAIRKAPWPSRWSSAPDARWRWARDSVRWLPTNR